MLHQLIIHNFALIEKLDVEFHPGFSVITGETGAGKSIILGALGLLLGNRADSKAIKEGAQRCIIEAHFDIAAYDMEPFFNENDIEYWADDCILRREVNANGKSRAFINDTPVSLAVMKELGEQLIDIHSQHQNLLLQKDDFQLSVVDIIAHNQALLADYRRQYQLFHDCRSRLRQLKADIEANQANADFLRFQYEELERMHLVSGEEVELEQLSNTMQHSEEIKTALYDADTAFANEDHGILIQLHHALSGLRSITTVCPQAKELEERLDSSYIEIKDIAAEVSSLLDDIDFDPAEQERVDNRLDAIYTLEQKHHLGSVDELIALQEQLHQSLQNIDNSDMAIQDLEKELKAAEEATAKLASQLTARRKDAALTIQKEMAERLKPLGLPNIRFQVSISPTELSSDGADRAEFLFSANPGTPLRPVAQIASGGEVARVMLSLKAMLSGAVKLPTIIFDEIDTGVSGRVAEQMALIMNEMGQHERQVISITHLPQIAAQGSNHYKVYKDQGTDATHTHMIALDHDQRVNEIAQMLSGSSITPAAISNAKELLGA